MDKKKIVYWMITSLMLLIFAISGIKDLLQQEPVFSSMQRLGYPLYFMYIIGTAKIAGVLILIMPHKFYRLKEWAYAGFTFDILGAIASHLSIGEGFGYGGSGYGTALITLILIIISHKIYIKNIEPQMPYTNTFKHISTKCKSDNNKI